MAKLSKELKQEQQIAEGVAAFREARESMDSLALRLNDWIDQAAELGEDEYSDQLLETQCEIEDLSRNFSFFEILVTESAVTASAFNKLKGLSGVVSCCKGLLKGGVDLKSVGKQLGRMKTDLKKAKTSLRDMRAELSGEKDKVYTDLFGKKTNTDPKIAARIAEKKQARAARLAVKLEAKAAIPVESGVGEEVSAGIDAITAMIDEEKKKK